MVKTSIRHLQDISKTSPLSSYKTSSRHLKITLMYLWDRFNKTALKCFL